MRLKVVAYERGTLPEPAPGFTTPFLERQRTAFEQTQAEDARIDRYCRERFGRVWRMYHAATPWQRCWNRLMFVLGR